MADVLVTIQQGKLKGKTSTDHEGKNYYSFQGIPYAQAPIGKLRFKDPQSPEHWKGIRDATKEGGICLQYDFVANKPIGGDDCLYLNVYTPQIGSNKDDSLKPVLFWVHGGAFILGSGNTDVFGPDYLVARDVVLVTINYRIGLLGFLRLEDPNLEVTGNAGFKDIVQALRWVKSNIENFQGDPNNVTIFGESAGSAAVHYLLLSPTSRGLFHKAILQSGSAFNPWATGEQKNEVLTQALGLTTTDEKQILEVLEELPVEKLLDVQQKLRDNSFGGGIQRPFAIGCNTPSTSAFLPEEAKTIFQAGRYHRVPVIIGYNDAEGILGLFSAMQKGSEPVHKDFEYFVPHAFGLERGSEGSKRIAQKIKEFYYKDREPSLETLDTYLTLESDVSFIYGIQKTIENTLRNSQQLVFFYRFCFDGEANFLKKMIQCTIKGASHADELGYLFKGQRGQDLKPGPEEVTMKRLTKLWGNFARYGDPNPSKKDELLDVEWNPVGKNGLNYLNIDKELSTGVNPEAERIAFWDSLYEDFPDAKFW